MPVLHNHVTQYFGSPTISPVSTTSRNDVLIIQGKKNYESHTIAYVHNIAHANCRTCTLFLPEKDWDRECDRQLFVSLGHFFALLPHYWPEKLKFGKNVKNPGDIILVHMCTINEDHMIYGSWDITHDWQMEIPVSHEDIIILQMSIKNHDHMLYCSWDIVHDGCNCFLRGGIFCRFTLITAQKSWSYAIPFQRYDTWPM